MKRKKILKAFIAAGCVGCMVIGTSAPAYAWNKYAYDYPTTETSIYNADGARYATAIGAHGSAVIGEYVGLSEVVGEAYDSSANGVGTSNYMYNPFLGVFGTSANENPDPYAANLMYNWYAEATNAASGTETLKKSDNAKINYLFSQMVGSAITSDNDSHKDGTSISLSFRPDVLEVTTGAETQFDDQIAKINKFADTDDENHQYYKAESDTYVGDENYDPVVCGYDESNFITQTDNIYAIANAAVQVETNAKAANKKIVTRYGDSLETAQKYELATKGSILYTLSQLKENGGTVDKKTIAVVKSIDGTGKNATVTLAGNADPSIAREKTHLIEGLFTTCNNLANVINPDLEWQGKGTLTEQKCTVEQLSQADVIILAFPDNFAYNFTNAQNGCTWTKYGKSTDEDYGQTATRTDGEGHYKNCFWGPQAATTNLASNIKAALYNLGTEKGKALANKSMYTCTQEGTTSSDGGSIEAYGQYALMNAFVYPEISNQLTQYGWWLTEIAHVKTDQVSRVVQIMCQDLSLADGVSMSDIKGYNASTTAAITEQYKAGIRYYKAHQSDFSEDGKYPWLQLTENFDIDTWSKAATPTTTAKKTQTIKVTPAKKTFKKAKVAKKAQKYTLKVKGAQGKVTFKSNKKKVVVKNGKVTVKKGFKGTATIKVTAAATTTYNASKTVSVKVVVK